MAEHSKSEKNLDWEEIRRKLNESQVQHTRTEVLSEAKVKEILEARAKALSQSADTVSGASLSLVVFKLADETYGIATEYLREVQPLVEITPVPCTPDFVVGVINIRGSIYSVIDIRSFFGVPKREITNLTKVILVHAAGLELGIIADDVVGAASVLSADIKPAPAAGGTVHEEYIYGVTRDMLIILNLEALLRDEQIIVQEEV
jgi:purine-binding chemotaxis protein CheW